MLRRAVRATLLKLDWLILEVYAALPAAAAASPGVDYFPHRTDHVIANIGGARGGSPTPDPGEVFIDLTRPLDEALCGTFDAVFNHTVLEHVFDMDRAVENLCALPASR